MSLIKSHRPSPWMLVAVAALAFAMVGTAVAGTDVASKLTKSKVKTIAKKQADKELKANVAGSHVNTADTATSATTASNANALGGKSLAQTQPIFAGQNNPTVISPLPGTLTDVASVAVNLPTASTVQIHGAVELQGASADERAACVAARDGTTVGVSYETTFDDIGSDNEATVAVEGFAPTVTAGAHTFAIRCETLAGTVLKDDAGINVNAIGN
jgi:hypothetical protein